MAQKILKHVNRAVDVAGMVLLRARFRVRELSLAR